MAYRPIRALNAGEPIADKNGRVTTTFALLWQQLFSNGDFLNIGKQDADPDLDALAALSGTGIAVRTSNTPTWTTRAITVGPGLTVTNGDGVAGNPLIELDAPVGGGTYIPLVDGAEPPSLITDGAGNLVMVPWSPE